MNAYTNKQAAQRLIELNAKCKHEGPYYRPSVEEVQAAKDCTVVLLPEGHHAATLLVKWALGQLLSRTSWAGTVGMIADNSAQLDVICEDLLSPLNACPYVNDPYFVGVEIPPPDQWDLSDEDALDRALAYLTHDGTYAAYHETCDDMRVGEREDACIAETQISALLRGQSAAWGGRLVDAFYDALYHLDSYTERQGYEDYHVHTNMGDNEDIERHMMRYLRARYSAAECRRARKALDLDLDILRGWLAEWIN
jgi:hypothetical protein